MIAASETDVMQVKLIAKLLLDTDIKTTEFSPAIVRMEKSF